MRVVKRIIVGLFSLLLLAAISLWITDNEHIIYGIRKTYLVGKKNPDIDDKPYFDVRKVEALMTRQENTWRRIVPAWTHFSRYAIC